MRIFEFVPFGRRGVLLEDEEDEKKTKKSVPTPALLNPNGEKRRRKASSTTWRPSLGAIFEEGAVLLSPNISDRKVRKSTKIAPASTATTVKGGKTGKARPCLSDRDDDFRHFPVPPFAPTAFLF